MLRIRMLREGNAQRRAYSEKAMLRVPLGAGACARRGAGEAGNGKSEARVARGKLIGRSAENAHGKHA